MKKRIFGVLFGAAFLTAGLINFISVEKAKANMLEFSSEERARSAYCQIFGDRTGCKNDASRTCSLTVFCS